MTKTILSVVILLVASSAQAAHNNPWATPEDDVLAKNHEQNQEKSIGTPEQDEMRGIMNQNARGKLDSSTPKQGNPSGGHGK